MDEMLLKIKDQTSRIINALQEDLGGIRTGRANPSLLENVKVEVYGQIMTLKEVAMIASPDPKLLSVQPWDANNTASIIKGIRDAGMNLNPVEDSGTIRVALPQITAERRVELGKLVNAKAEEKRVQVRQVRRDAFDTLSRQEKSGSISEDDQKRSEGQIQKAIDSAISEIDKLAETKEAELQEI